MYAMREFESEVAQSARAPLSPDEIEPQEGETSVKRKKGERITGVRQAKIVRQAEKIDPLTGKGKSKGYGFLELDKHADALRVLRWANNNSDAGGLLYGWWKEELEDMEKRKVPEGDSSKKDPDAKAYEAQRLKKVKEKLREVKGMIEKKATKVKPLLLEFSIENVNVVKRRSDKEKEIKDGGGPRLKRKVSVSSHSFVTSTLTLGRVPQTEDQETEDSGKRGAKRSKVDRSSKRAEGVADIRKKTTETPAQEKGGSTLGRIIGKKRKERRAKA